MMKVKDENLPIRSGVFDTCPIVESDSIVKKKLSDIDCFALRYAAIELWRDNECFGDPEPSINAFDESNAIQDNGLYLGDFEGFWLNEDILIRTLFLTTDNRICANVEHNNEYLVVLVD